MPHLLNRDFPYNRIQANESVKWTQKFKIIEISKEQSFEDFEHVSMLFFLLDNFPYLW